MSRTDLLWAMLAGTGVLLLSGPSASSMPIAGVEFALASGACMAAYLVLNKRAGAVDDAPLAWAVVFAALLVLPLAPFAGRALLRPDVLLAGLGVAVLSAVVPWSLDMAALRRLPDRVVAVMVSLEPAAGALAGLVVLGERLAWADWLAIGCVSGASAGVAVSRRGGRWPAVPAGLRFRQRNLSNRHVGGRLLVEVVTLTQQPGPAPQRTDAQFWDERYRGRDQVFSGEPNAVLVTEVADLAPGQALDVGCGEGADAVWLARHGWQVTAVDVSLTALRRAAAADVAGRVAWARADLTATPPPARSFDLVSVQYFPLPHQPGHTALRSLLAAVAPGGTLLVVSHDPADLTPRPGFDPGDYYQPADIAGVLDPDWTVLVNESRPRRAPAPAGTHHTRDTVLRARRLR